MNLIWGNKGPQNALGVFQVTTENEQEQAILKMILSIASQAHLVPMVTSIDQEENGEVSGFAFQFMAMNPQPAPQSVMPPATEDHLSADPYPGIQSAQQSEQILSGEQTPNTDDSTQPTPEPSPK